MDDARGSYRSAFRHHDFRLLLIALIVSDTGSWSYNVALAVFAFERTHSPAWVAAVSLARFIPALLFSAYGGVVAERFERVRLMMSADIVMCALQALLALLVAFDGPLVPAIVLAALTSIVGTVYKPAVAAMIPQVVGEDDLVAANALEGTVDNLVIVVGPAIGAALLLLGSAAFAFAANAATFALSAIIVGSMHQRSRPGDVTEGGTAGPLRQMRIGLSSITHSPTVATLVSFSVVASFIYGTDTVLFVSLSKLQLGTGADGYGYLLAGCGVGGLLAAGLVNRLAAVPRLSALITGGLIIYSLPTAVLVFTHSPAVAFGLEVVRGAGTLIVDVLAITALQRTVSAQLIARVFGVFFALVLAAISVGAVITPSLLGSLGLHGTLLLLGLGVPVCVGAVYPWVRRTDAVAMKGAGDIAPKVAAVQKAAIFHAASRPILERLAASATEVRLAAGEVVITEGDPADALFLLVEGEVDVSAAGELGEPRFLRRLSAGSYFGEIGLLEHIQRTATVRAASACTLLAIPGESFFAALTEAPASSVLLEGARARLTLTHPSYAAGPDTPPASAGRRD